MTATLGECKRILAAAPVPIETGSSRSNLFAPSVARSVSLFLGEWYVAVKSGCGICQGHLPDAGVLCHQQSFERMNYWELYLLRSSDSMLKNEAALTSMSFTARRKSRFEDCQATKIRRNGY